MSSYSVAIRTLGKAGEKYQKLLDSICASKNRPEKVIVVLPEGAEPPRERLGYEQFVYCPKSMIGQRLEALKYIQSEYTLFLDDDISFPSDFVDKLLKPLDDGRYDCATGPLFSFFPASFAGKIAGTLTASVSVSVFRRDLYVKILRSGGWSYHTFRTDIAREYPTESFAWTCFLIRTEVLRNLEMEDEICWVQKYGYAYGDDRVMAYKLIKRGYKACVVSDALYDHNDAKTSTSSSEMSNTKPVFCNAHFHVVFWRRFIQDIEVSRFLKVCNAICFGYWRLSMLGYHLAKALKPDHRPRFKAFREGLKAGSKYIRSEEYQSLPPLVNSQQCPGRRSR